MERIAVAVELDCNPVDRCSVVQFVADELVVAVQHMLCLACLCSVWSPYMSAFGFQACQRIACTLADEVALDLCGESEGERQHLGLKIIAQTVTVLDRPYTATAPHAQTQDLHNHVQRTPQTAELATDDQVAFFRPLEQLA